MTNSYDTGVAVMKDIYAIVSGICTVQGYGDNFLAVLLSDAVREIKIFINPIHPITCDQSLSANLIGNN